MARKNARQKRAAKRRIALTELANARNATTQADTGHVRNSAKGHILRDNTLYVGVNPGMRELNPEARGRDAKILKRGGKVKLVPKRPTTAKAARPDFTVIVERNDNTRSSRFGRYETTVLFKDTLRTQASKIAKQDRNDPEENN